MTALNGALTRRDLDNIPCGNPKCKHTAHDEPMYVHGHCHIQAPVVCIYQDGVLEIRCTACGDLVTRIAVAP
jgi:hypothetical protein